MGIEGSFEGSVQLAIYGQALTEIAESSAELRRLLLTKLDEAVVDIVRVRTLRGVDASTCAPPETAAQWLRDALGGLSTDHQMEACRRGLIGLQYLVDVDQRAQVAERMVGAVNRHLHIEAAIVDESAAAAVESLRSEGYCRFGRLLDPEGVVAARSFLESRPCYNAHAASMSDNFARRLGAGAEDFHFGSYSLSDIVRAPGLIELANSPLLIGAAEQYLGCVPTLYSLNAWWSFPSSKGPARYSQSFHRDRDDFRFCTLFIYLTDVDSQTGPHVYVRRTHRRDLIEQRLADVGEGDIAGLPGEERQMIRANTLSSVEGYGADRIVQALFGAQTDTVLGEAGTAIFADTFGFHKGILPTARPRLMFWARYGTYPNFNPPTQRVDWSLAGSRLPSDLRTRYINRALFSGERPT